MTDDEIMDRFTALIRGGVKFVQPDRSRMGKWELAIAANYFDRGGVPWSRGVEKVGKATCLKIDDKIIKYLVILPMGSYDGQKCDQFACFIGLPLNDDTAITPDAMSMRLLERSHPGLKSQTITDEAGNTIHRLSKDGGEVLSVWPADWKEGKVKGRRKPPSPSSDGTT